jgi:hypothetical protein
MMQNTVFGEMQKNILVKRPGQEGAGNIPSMLSQELPVLAEEK